MQVSHVHSPLCAAGFLPDAGAGETVLPKEKGAAGGAGPTCAEVGDVGGPAEMGLPPKLKPPEGGAGGAAILGF